MPCLIGKSPNSLSVKVNSLLFILPFVTFLFIVPAVQAEPNKTDIVQKYEKAIHQAEELKVYEQDILHVVPKLQLAMVALLQDDLNKADHIIDQALADLELLSAEKPTQLHNAFRLEWLELYIGIVQKYAWIALMGYLFVRLPYFRSKLLVNRLPSMTRVYITVLTCFSALFFSFFDVHRYGVSAWAFFDIQVVLLAIGGLLGGLASGLFAGLIVGAFRLILQPDLFIYAVIALLAGITGGVAAFFLKDFQHARKGGFLTGLVVGLLHACIIYLPSIGHLSLIYVAASILFVTLLEAVAVFLFFAIIEGILREANRRKMEHELLRTKLLFLQAQISPHFLFNALNTISAICSHEKAPKARELVLHLAQFFRRALKRVDDEITLEEELLYIDSYLEIEKVRFQERLKVVKRIDLPASVMETKIPFLVLQPLVENAIKHGISAKEAGGTLTMELSLENHCLRVDVTDDGIGAEEKKIENILNNVDVPKEVGIGLQNIHQRLRQSYGEKFGLAFKTAPGQGMKMTVRIPLVNHSGKGAQG